jgi:hypothetical protein
MARTMLAYAAKMADQARSSSNRLSVFTMPAAGALLRRKRNRGH